MSADSCGTILAIALSPRRRSPSRSRTNAHRTTYQCELSSSAFREKFTKEIRAPSAARRAIREYFKRYHKEQFQTEVESWRHLQSQNLEFTMKRLRELIHDDSDS